MTPTEAKREIESRLEGDALDYWNGAAPDIVNEWIILAQREGVDEAVAEIEVCAEPDPDQHLDGCSCGSPDCPEWQANQPTREDCQD